MRTNSKSIQACFSGLRRYVVPYRDPEEGIATPALIAAVIFLPLGLIELWKWLGSNGTVTGTLAIAVVFWIAVHMLVVPIARYMVPICPVIILAGCVRMSRIFAGEAGGSRALTLPYH